MNLAWRFRLIDKIRGFLNRLSIAPCADRSLSVLVRALLIVLCFDRCAVVPISAHEIEASSGNRGAASLLLHADARRAHEVSQPFAAVGKRQRRRQLDPARFLPQGGRQLLGPRVPEQLQLCHHDRGSDFDLVGWGRNRLRRGHHAGSRA